MPTLAELLPKMNPRQLREFEQLKIRWRLLKESVTEGDDGKINGVPIEVIEPVLQSPRSAINPEFFKRLGMLDAKEASDE
jgi:hypothetical protein